MWCSRWPVPPLPLRQVRYPPPPALACHQDTETDGAARLPELQQKVQTPDPDGGTLQRYCNKPPVHRGPRASHLATREGTGDLPLDAMAARSSPVDDMQDVQHARQTAVPVVVPHMDGPQPRPGPAGLEDLSRVTRCQQQLDVCRQLSEADSDGFFEDDPTGMGPCLHQPTTRPEVDTCLHH